VRYGPYHRRTTAKERRENDKVVASGLLWGRRRGNYYAALSPAVKAWEGPLPAGVPGFEFFTEVEPDPGCAPGWPQWSEGRPGVIVLERDELVAISVIVTKRQDSE
jgi:hypothetical protein